MDIDYIVRVLLMVIMPATFVYGFAWIAIDIIQQLIWLHNNPDEEDSEEY